ncbi:Fasciclin-like arabinogalactan protein 3 [Striga hermonthica]|uniref:Fasciclin-like arabinogalactan protein 3 n=1 Tax=Striga hermonthica TaxID=68872 RepID=A0A9N7NK00_STRHE|nr:Fasciclin-like arabinogalactan protein 3 [Striga hermonthica]
MSPSTISFIFTSFLLLSTTITAHNITSILDQYPDFSQFNALLSQTHLAEVINHRKPLTILALTNARLADDLSGKPEDVVKRILSTHVLLDYYNVLKLNKLRGNHTIITTLYQSTGTADDQQGFINVAHNQGGIFFGSAMKGAPTDSKLEGSVAALPYNISVLSVSHVIVAPGIDGSWRPINVSAPPPKEAAAAAPEVEAPAESPEDDLPAADGPDVDVETPASAPAPGPGPNAAPADVEADDEVTVPPASASWRTAVSGSSVGLVAAAALVLMWM